ncbi:MAG: CDP-alcohol phosphatidyltransferase family protein [Betaproteobacteria bacterium]|nr:CDP-alcohol phosphatidyltransferase family protein [Betaproteobacteria bacterium]
MIDGHFGDRTRRIWEFLARGLVRAGCSPNGVTLAGLALVLVASLDYLWRRDSLVYGLCLAFALSSDGLDGAVARLSGRSTRYGGYLDAVADRYQEIAVLAAIAWVADCWPAAFFAITGALLTSYHKARVALEIRIDNNDWPDLLERLERMILLIALLLADALLSPHDWPLLPGGLLVLGALAHLTALQRFLRARQRLMQADRDAPGP